MEGLVGFANGVVSGIKWLFENLVYILAAIGAAAVIVRSVDDAVEKAIERWPDNRFWRWLDYALDGGNAVLTWIIDTLHKIALRKPQP